MVRIIDMECNMPRRGSYSIDFSSVGWSGSFAVRAVCVRCVNVRVNPSRMSSTLTML